MKKQLLYLLGATLFFAACKKDDSPAPVDDTYVPDNSFKIVAYMPSYRDPATVADQKYKMITHLFYAFLNPTTNADGSLQPLAQQGRFATVKAKAKANKVKVADVIRAIAKIKRAGLKIESTREPGHYFYD